MLFYKDFNEFISFCKFSKLKNTENDAQIIREEDLSAYRAKGIYMRDDHCDWGSSGMEALVDQINDSN